MNWDISSTYRLVYLVCALLMLGLAAIGWQRPTVRGAPAFGWYALSRGLWTLALVLELFAVNLDAKAWWDKFQWAVVPLMVLSQMAFAITYSEIQISRPALFWSVMAAPHAIFLLLLADPVRAWIYTDPRVVAGNLSAGAFSFGSIAGLYALICIVTSLSSIGVVLARLGHLVRLYHLQVIIVAAGCLLPIFGTLLDLTGATLPGNYDTMPVTLALSSAAIAWGLFRYRILDLYPIARDTVIEGMHDLVIVLDTQDRVVDINAAALRALGMQAQDVIGHHSTEVFAEWPELLAKFGEPRDVQTETTIRAYGDIFHFEIGSTVLQDGHGTGIGRVFVARNINQRVAMLQSLKRLNEDLEQRVEERTAELADAYDTTLRGWAKALELKDEETEGHSRRVTELTLTLATAMGICDEDLVHIRRGAILHDIGKLAIPDRILQKRGDLTDEERSLVNRHPITAYELLAPIKYLDKALEIPYCHHEKWNGEGYPRGLKGEAIPLSARIFTVADVWDALCTERPYRRGLPRGEAAEYIRAQSGIDFDPQVVQLFLQLFEQGKI